MVLAWRIARLGSWATATVSEPTDPVVGPGWPSVSVA